MAEVVKPITKMLDKRMRNKMDALEAFNLPILDGDPEIKRIREMEAMKLRHEVAVLRDVIDVIEAMYPQQ